ncbi:zinc finger C2HC domain-containing protein 1A-like isoform X2 [Antedon mediterranea]|uniref:zinc finger C2HC domain-containing protein 1A-like isoform X2 n=1 Tax=Antedon mediterranea TaxID=105859 RepID=UPI003AF67A6A
MYDEEYEDEPYAPAADVQPCACCGRTFVPETLMKHEPICFKSNTKKRKVFNSAKQRADGTDLIVSKKTPSKLPPSKSKSNWRAKHEEFISTMKAAKKVSHAIKTGGELPPPPKPTYNPDYVECPCCARRFNSSAAERHIPWCQEKQKRIVHKSPVVKKENVAIRTKYKPPLPGVKKGSASGQKGSPSGQKGSPSGSRSGSGVKGSKSSHEVSSLYDEIDHMQISRKPVSMNGINLRKRSNSLDRKKPKPREPVINQRRSNSGDSRFSSNRYDDLDDNNDDDDADYHNRTYNSYRRDSGSGGNRISSADSSSNPFSKASALPSISKEAGSNSSRTSTPSSRNSSGSAKRASRFCHECGTRYPVSNAKFCCECGSKRMWIEA